MALVHVDDGGGDLMELLDIDGYPLCTFGQSAEVTSERFRSVHKFPCREDDIFICAPGKSGTHWVWEMVSMLCNGNTETIPKSKAQHMVEATEWAKMEDLPSPRVLNSHVHYERLPTQMKELGCKIVFVLRNPKDVAVSHYNHCLGLTIYKYSGKWENFFNLFMNGKLEYGSWFTYVREWEDLIAKHPDLPIHVVYYEDLKEKNVEEMYRLGKFLGIDNKDKLFERVSDKCQFKNMKKDKQYPPELQERFMNGDFSMFRKGDIGDWKNWFTPAQLETFEKEYAKRMEGSKLKFRYESSN